jgi:hypothetical protein
MFGVERDPQERARAVWMLPARARIGAVPLATDTNTPIRGSPIERLTRRVIDEGVDPRRATG